MNRCDLEGPCPACGSGVRKTTFYFDYRSGHVERRCSRCSYRWEEAPLFSEAADFFLRQFHDDHACPACRNSGATVKYVDSGFDLQNAVGGSSLLEPIEEYYGTLESHLPFMVRGCKNCYFVWPETPLNNSQEERGH